MNQSSKFRPGNLTREETAAGFCYYVRFQHTAADGTKKRERIRLGLEKDFPSKSAAIRAARALADKFNAQPEALLQEKRRFYALIDRYRQEEMPTRHSTRVGYENLLRNHIGPKWGNEFLVDVRPMKVNEWLRSLNCSSRTRGHIHAMMRILYRHAMLWEWIPFGENPMSLFRTAGSTRRRTEPHILTVEQFAEIVAHVTQPHYRTMVLVAGCTGLRCSEIVALKWKDVLFESLGMRVERAIVDQKVDDVKTIYSKKTLPLDPALAEELLAHRGRVDFNKPEDWIFASPWLLGRMPYRPKNVQEAALRPAQKALNLGFSLGWHTFRHSYKSWLDDKGVPLTVQRDLMRHADTRTTAQVYGAVDLERLRAANSELVNRLFRGSE